MNEEIEKQVFEVFDNSEVKNLGSKNKTLELLRVVDDIDEKMYDQQISIKNNDIRFYTYANYDTNMIIDDEEYEMSKNAMTKIYQMMPINSATIDYLVNINQSELADELLNTLNIHASKAHKNYQDRVLRIEFDSDKGTHKVKGVVSKRYPLWMKTNKWFNATFKHMDENDIDYKLSRPHIFENGKISLSVKLPDHYIVAKQSMEKDDIVDVGFRMSNSETGNGSFKLSIFGERLVCTNGMTMPTDLASFDVGHYSTLSFTNKLFQFMIGQLTDKFFVEEPAYVDIYDYLKKDGDLRENKLFEELFYEKLGEATVTYAIKNGAKVIKESIDKAQEHHAKDWKKELEAQMDRYNIPNREFAMTLAENDPTINIDQLTAWEVANIFTRMANKPDLPPVTVERLQEVGGEVLSKPLITASW